MCSMRRLLIGLVGSAALHSAVLLGLSLIRGPEVKVEYEIDVVNAPPAPPAARKGEQRGAHRAAGPASQFEPAGPATFLPS